MTTQPKEVKDWRLTSCYCLFCHTPLGKWVGDEVPFPEEHPLVHLCRSCAADAKHRERTGETIFVRYLEMPVEIIIGTRRGRGRPPVGAPPDPFKDPGLAMVTKKMLEAENSERAHYQGSQEGETSGRTDGRRRKGSSYEDDAVLGSS